MIGVEVLFFFASRLSVDGIWDVRTPTFLGFLKNSLLLYFAHEAYPVYHRVIENSKRIPRSSK